MFTAQSSIRKYGTFSEMFYAILMDAIPNSIIAFLSTYFDPIVSPNQNAPFSMFALLILPLFSSAFGVSWQHS
jgi:hypothetical protein